MGSETPGDWDGVWDTVISSVQTTDFTISLLTVGVSLVGILANIFHFLVLKRKSMRILTTNAFLIGVAVCDIMRMATTSASYFLLFFTYFETALYGHECVSPRSYTTMVVMHFSMPTETFSRQLVVWYGVTIAILRALVIRNPLNERIGCLADSKYGIRILIIVTFFMIPSWLFHYFQVGIWESGPFIPSESCGFPTNYTQMGYYYGSGSLGKTGNLFGKYSGRVYLISLYAQAVLCTLIPSILLPIATIILIRELKKAKNVAENLRSQNNRDSSERSTRLVIYMTVSFLVANAPLGLLYLVEYPARNDAVLWYITQKLEQILNFLNVINGFIHFFICFFMSSQYQSAARSLFWKDTANVVSIARSTRGQNDNHSG